MHEVVNKKFRADFDTNVISSDEKLANELKEIIKNIAMKYNCESDR